jgi:hypothetical protein
VFAPSWGGRGRSLKGRPREVPRLDRLDFRLSRCAGQSGRAPEGFFGGIHAQATSEYVQSCASTAFDRQRPDRFAPELSVMLRTNRARSDPHASASQVPRDAEVHTMRALRPLHRRGRVVATGHRSERVPARPVQRRGAVTQHTSTGPTRQDRRTRWVGHAASSIHRRDPCRVIAGMIPAANQRRRAHP